MVASRPDMYSHFEGDWAPMSTVDIIDGCVKDLLDRQNYGNDLAAGVAVAMACYVIYYDGDYKCGLETNTSAGKCNCKVAEGVYHGHRKAPTQAICYSHPQTVLDRNRSERMMFQ